MKFRKKPVVVEAIQFNGGNVVDIHRFTNAKSTDSTHNNGGPATSVAIHTLEGTMTALPGDWIIKGVKGEFYPCKPDIFAATYEALEEQRSEVVQSIEKRARRLRHGVLKVTPNEFWTFAKELNAKLENDTQGDFITLYVENHRLRLEPTAEAQDDTNRCAICAWPLKATIDEGCVRGNCSQRPPPSKFYAPARALLEQGSTTKGAPDPIGPTEGDTPRSPGG